MFRIEQNVSKKVENIAKKVVFPTGTTLAKAGNVKRNIAYKEILLAVGIAVAILVALTLWDRPVSGQASAEESKNIPALNLQNAAKTLFRISVKLFVSNH